MSEMGVRHGAGSLEDKLTGRSYFAAYPGVALVAPLSSNLLWLAIADQPISWLVASLNLTKLS